MKKMIVGLSLVLFASSLALAAPEQKAPAKPAVSRVAPSDAPYSMGGKYLTAQIGLNKWAIPFGANFEYGLTENIGVGGNLMMWFWSEDFGFGGDYSASVIVPEVDAAYHFTSLDVEKLDLYGGAGIGFAMYHSSYSGIGSGGSSGLYLTPFAGARYYLTPKIGVSLRLNFGLVGDWGGVGALLGATFKL